MRCGPRSMRSSVITGARWSRFAGVPEAVDRIHPSEWPRPIGRLFLAEWHGDAGHP
jgi:hypothetical protein